MKIVDQIYACQLSGQVFGDWELQCHLRIFESHPEVQTVVITDMGVMMRWFIPYLVEPLIDQIIREFHLNPAHLIWIEHYTSNFRKPSVADFNQVTVEWQNGQAINPQWTAITPQRAQALINEALSSVAVVV